MVRLFLSYFRGSFSLTFPFFVFASLRFLSVIFFIYYFFLLTGTWNMQRGVLFSLSVW